MARRRVQSPALRLIVEKEIEISNFKPVEFLDWFYSSLSNKDCIDLDLVSIDGEKIKKGNITSIKNDSEASAIKKDLVQYNKIEIDDIKTSDRN